MTNPTPPTDASRWEELRTKIGESIGAASTCWENMSGTGVFDSDRALAISVQLKEDVAAALAQVAAEAREQALEEAAELVRKWAQDDECVFPTNGPMTAAILALKKGAP